MIDFRRAVVVNAIRVDRSIVACSRIARFLRERYDVPVLDHKDALPSFELDRYRTAILINSPWGFCDAAHRDNVAKLLRHVKRVVWVQNDYNGGIGPRSLKQLSHEWLNRGNPISVWTTVPHFLEKWVDHPKIPLDSKRSRYVNWNALHFAPCSKPLGYEFREKRLTYYGAFRPGRAEAFRRYFADRRSPFPLTVSTSKVYGAKSFRPLLERRPNVELTGPYADPVYELSRVALALYVEDEFARERYVSPAGRFYEALSARTVQLLDADSVPTLRQAGLDPDGPWVVRSAKDIEAWAAKHWMELHNAAQEQYTAWAVRHRPRAQFLQQLERAISL